ncbi:MAG: hypothetical protein ABI641_11765 [Caldimonas sp.]
MTAPRDKDRPMAEVGRQHEGADLGGILQSADGGLSDALERQAERRDDDPRGRAGVGDGTSSADAPHPREGLGGKASPASAHGTDDRSDRPRSAGGAASSSAHPAAASGQRPAAGDDDDDGPWRHEPVAPKDANPLKSFGRAVSDVITGPLDDATGKPKA